MRLIDSLDYRIKSIPGWLRIFEKYGNLAPEEVAEIEQREDDEMKIASAIEKDYYENEHPKVRKMQLEIKKDKEMRNECAEGMKEGLEASKNQIIKYLAEGNIREAKELINEAEDLEKQYAWLRSDYSHTGGKNMVSDEMLERARKFPIENILSVNKNFALCPFHDDHSPSLYVKNGHAYCFACQYNGDAIQITMDLHKVSFQEAVKELCSKH